MIAVQCTALSLCICLSLSHFQLFRPFRDNKEEKYIIVVSSNQL